MMSMRQVFVWLAVAILPFSAGEPVTAKPQGIQGPTLGQNLEWMVVDLALEYDTVVKATIFNFSPKDVTGFAIDNFLDDLPVDRFYVDSTGKYIASRPWLRY